MKEVGKSELLMSIVTHCILPKSLSGCECDVIFINTDYTFKIATLLQVLEKKLVNSRALLDSILDRFHLFTSASITNCNMALMTLLHFSSVYSNIGLVIIDDIGAIQLTSKSHTKITDCVDTLTKIAQKYNLIIILSNFLQLSDTHYFKLWMKLVNFRLKMMSSVEGIFIRQTLPEGQNMLVTL